MSYRDGYDVGPMNVPIYPNGHADRLPPRNADAEMGVLGSILLEDTVLADVVDWLRPEHFHLDAHAIIYKSMLAVYNRGTAVDIILVIQDLQETGQFDNVGGDDYITKIVQSVPHSANGRFYAGIVVELAERRKMIEVAKEVIRDGYSNQFNSAELKERMSETLTELEPRAADDDDDFLTEAPPTMGEAAFRGLAGCIVECIRHQTEACAEAILIQFLVAIGNLYGMRPHFMVGGKASRCNLYSCLVGPSGCGKGMAWEAVRWMLSKVSGLFVDKPILTGMTSGEGVIMELKEAAGRPVLAVETEFGRTLNNLNRDGNSLDAILRQAFEDTTLRVPTKNCPITAENAHLSVIGHIPEFELKEKMSSVVRDNGFAGRFLWARAYLFQLKPGGGDFGSVASALELYETALIEAVKFARELDPKHEYTRDPEAEALWYQVYSPLRMRPPGPYGNATSKAANLTMRLAVIYAALDKSAVVTLTHLESALAVWAYCDATAKALFGDGRSDRKMDKLVAALEVAKEGMTRAEISRKVFSGHLTKAELLALLEAAQAAGLLVYTERSAMCTKRLWVHSKNSENCAFARRRPNP
jgi:hypothetical protein